MVIFSIFFFSSRRRHTRCSRDWSSEVCSSDLVLIVERRDDERMIRKPGFFHYSINLGLAGKMRNVELASADRVYIRQRRPDKVFNARTLGCTYRSGSLLGLVCTFFPQITD